MFKSQFEITNPKLKAFIYNEKVYKPVLNTMFVLSSICFSAIIADACRSTLANDTKILFMNMVWVLLYLIAAILHVKKVGLAPLAFAISVYFVSDYTIGSLLSAVYDMHFLPITNTIEIWFVFVVLFLYWCLKKFSKNEGDFNNQLKYPIKKIIILWQEYFFAAAGVILGEIVVIIDLFILRNEKTIIEYALFITSVVLMLLFLLVYNEHYNSKKSLFNTLVTVGLMLTTYCWGVGGFFFEGYEIEISFWYSLFDALNLIG